MTQRKKLRCENCITSFSIQLFVVSTSSPNSLIDLPHNVFQQDDVDEEEDEDEDEDDEEDPKSEKKAASEYKRLIAIHAGKGKGGLSDWLRVDLNKVRRLSLSEPELEKAVDTHSKEIIRYFSLFIHQLDTKFLCCL